MHFCCIQTVANVFFIASITSLIPTICDCCSEQSAAFFNVHSIIVPIAQPWSCNKQLCLPSYVAGLKWVQISVNANKVWQAAMQITLLLWGAVMRYKGVCMHVCVCYSSWKYQKCFMWIAEVTRGVEIQIQPTVHGDSQIIYYLPVDGSPDIFSVVFLRTAYSFRFRVSTVKH